MLFLLFSDLLADMVCCHITAELTLQVGLSFVKVNKWQVVLPGFFLEASAHPNAVRSN
jgi:hypothetical protein